MGFGSLSTFLSQWWPNSVNQDTDLLQGGNLDLLLTENPCAEEPWLQWG